MKNKQTETKFKSALGVAGHLFNRVVCLGAVILICSSAPAQNLFVAAVNASGGKVLKFTHDGVQSTFASGLEWPWDLAFDSAGNLFVTDGLDVVGPGHANIYKFTPDGVRTTFASGLLAPEALAFDSAGNLFVLEGGDIDGLGAAIYQFTPGGVRSTFASPFLCIGPGLAIDSAGNLFVPDWCTGAIYKFTPGGVRSTFASGGVISPLGLDFDSAGNLFVTSGGDIYKFTPGGVRTTFASGSGAGLHFLAFQAAPTASPGQLQNISTRAFVQTGDNVMIGGVIITGSGQKKVILRAIGPSLGNYGITNPLQNPTLELHDHTGAVIASNDNWMDAPNKQEIIDSG